MNNYVNGGRRRNRTLLIVEGNHEKNILFSLLFKCFPEISVDINDVWIYGTNIYVLYNDIVKEYGSDWAQKGDEIDLPFVVSKKLQPDDVCSQRDFTNIIIVFDYERQDPNFSAEKILDMQKYFIDVADMGKLYINYPMIESYQHLRSLPDADYAERKVPASFANEKFYKARVRNETIIAGAVEFPVRLNDLLEKHLNISDEQVRERSLERITNISEECNMEEIIQSILEDVVEVSVLKTAKYQIRNWILRCGFTQEHHTYWIYMRDIFQQIVRHNIQKANRIQNNQYWIEEGKYKECFEKLSLPDILERQNLSSQDSSGYIWVLNTCVFFVADYNFALITG